MKEQFCICLLDDFILVYFIDKDIWQAVCIQGEKDFEHHQDNENLKNVLEEINQRVNDVNQLAETQVTIVYSDNMLAWLALSIQGLMDYQCKKIKVYDLSSYLIKDINHESKEINSDWIKEYILPKIFLKKNIEGYKKEHRLLNKKTEKEVAGLINHHNEPPMIYKQKGETKIVVPMSPKEIASRKSPYPAVLMQPLGWTGYFELNEKGDIIGFNDVRFEELSDVEISKHKTKHLFDNWDKSEHCDDPKIVYDTLRSTQQRIVLDQLEKEIKAKYGETGKVEDRFYKNTLQVQELYRVSPYQDYYLLAQLIKSNAVIDNEVAGLEHEKYTTMPINMPTFVSPSWVFNDEEAEVVNEFSKARSYKDVIATFTKLKDMVSISMIRSIDDMLTDWINTRIHRMYPTGGITGIDSFYQDILSLIEYANASKLTWAKDLEGSYKELVNTILKAHNSSDKEACKLFDLDPDSKQACFVIVDNVTVYDLDSFAFNAIIGDDGRAYVTRDQFDIMHRTLEFLYSIANPYTANHMVVTKDNRKFYFTKYEDGFIVSLR